MTAGFARKFTTVASAIASCATFAGRAACAALAFGATLAIAQPAPSKVTLTLGSDGYHYLLHRQ